MTWIAPRNGGYAALPSMTPRSPALPPGSGAPADTPGNRLVIELLNLRARSEITRHELHTRLPFDIPCPEDCDG